MLGACDKPGSAVGRPLGTRDRARRRAPRPTRRLAETFVASPLPNPSLFTRSAANCGCEGYPGAGGKTLCHAAAAQATKMSDRRTSSKYLHHVALVRRPVFGHATWQLRVKPVGRAVLACRLHPRLRTYGCEAGTDASGHQRHFRRGPTLPLCPPISNVLLSRSRRRSGPNSEVAGAFHAHYCSASSNVFASFRSSVSKPSVNQL